MGSDEDQKRRRRERRQRNLVAKALRNPLFRQRKKEGKPKGKAPEEEDDYYDET